MKRYTVPNRGGGRREVELDLSTTKLLGYDLWLAFPAVSRFLFTDDEDKSAAQLMDEFCHSSLISASLPPDVNFGRVHAEIDYDDMLAKTRERVNEQDVLNDEICETMVATFESWWKQEATRSERGEIASMSLLLSQRQFQNTVSVACDTLIALYRIRGGAKPFGSFHMLRPELSDLPLDKPEDLLNPAAFDLLFKGYRWARWFRLIERMHVRNMIGVGAITGKELHWRINETLAATNDPGIRERLENIRDAVPDTINPFRYHAEDFPVNGKEKRQLREARRVVLRGVAAFERCFGAKGRHDILTFLRGEPLFIRGRLFDYRALKSYAAWDHSIDPDCAHIPYHLAIYSKDGKRLANGCVYFNGAPLVDQLLGLCLHVRDAEDERVLLRQMNLAQHTEAFLTDPIMREVKPEPLPVYMTSRRVRMWNSLTHRGRMEEKAGPMHHTKRRMIPIALRMLADRVLIPPDMFNYYLVPPVSTRLVANRHHADRKAYAKMVDSAVARSIPVMDAFRRDLRSFVYVPEPQL
jgi:hypothetical protein